MITREQGQGAAVRRANLEDYSVIVFEGDDAVGFLQGQLTLDVKRLEPGTARMTAFTTPKGRVRALPRLCRDGDRVLAVLPAALAPPVAKALGLYVLRARVSISVPGLAVAAAWGPGAAGLAAELTGDTLALPPVTAGSPWLLVAPGKVGAGPLAAARPGTRADWELAEILAGVPEVLPATAEQFLPQMLGLDRLGGVSYAKGCYVGQEIVARAHHLGQVKRGLALYRCGPGAAPGPGDSLLEDGRAAGTALRVAPEGDGWRVLVVTRGDDRPALSLAGETGVVLEPVPTDWAPSPTPAAGGERAGRP